MSDLISRQAAIAKFEPWLKVEGYSEGELNMLKAVLYELRSLPSAEPEEYTELKRYFLRLECSDEQKETLIRLSSRLAEFMPLI